MTEARQSKSSHTSCSLDMVIVRRKGLKLLNTAETLKPLPDIFLKDSFTVQHEFQYSIQEKDQFGNKNILLWPTKLQNPEETR